MNRLRKYFCWLLGHKSKFQPWPYSGNQACTIMVPYCEHCDECLTILPIEMLMQKVHWDIYKDIPTVYKDIYKQKYLR